jgi:ubiquinone/menaquinone biosynthesis C-methylase UbiE
LNRQVLRDDISRHYSRGELLARLNAALIDDGVDPERPTIEALAPYDQFHGRGIDATAELAASVPARRSDHILDVGSGIGGPARYLATRFGCRVTGIDLTAEFCDVARHLTRLLGLDAQVVFENGDALHMPFADRTFDGAYSMNVSMNIGDKDAFIREIHRVLSPGAWLALSEIARGEGGEPDYPTPWAAGPQTSFLSTADETCQRLTEAGFEVERVHHTREASLEFGARARAIVERGEKPPHRSVVLIHGEHIGRQAMTNSARAVADGRLDPIELFARKRERHRP